MVPEWVPLAISRHQVPKNDHSHCLPVGSAPHCSIEVATGSANVPGDARETGWALLGGSRVLSLLMREL